jgi:hypothetical protein
VWDFAFFAIGAASAVVAAREMIRQLGGSGCESCPYKRSCKMRAQCKGKAPRPPACAICRHAT